MVSKKAIANAVSKFIENDLMQSIDGDTQVKFALGLAKQSLLNNPEIIDSFFGNPMIASVVSESDNMYDINAFADMLKKALDENGSFPISMPKIPLILPTEKIIRIESGDIDKIMNYFSPAAETSIILD